MNFLKTLFTVIAAGLGLFLVNIIAIIVFFGGLFLLVKHLLGV